MIWQPKPKQRITLKYRKTLRHDTGLHGATGIIETVASGVKTKNALIALDNGRKVVAPRGNLFIEEIHGQDLVYREAGAVSRAGV